MDSSKEKYITKPLINYLSDLAAKKPTPGGGSVAALHGALGAALVSMVCNFTMGKEKFKSVEETIRQIFSRSEELRLEFEKLIDLDVESYGRVAKAYAMPKGSERDAAIKQALQGSLKVCAQIGRLSYEGIKLCPELAKIGNPNLLSDVDCAVHSFAAAFKCAMVNVDVNLSAIKEEELTAEIRKIFGPMEEQVEMIIRTPHSRVGNTRKRKDTTHGSV